MSGADMARSRPVQSTVQPLTAQAFVGARPVIGQQPIQPTAETAGVTPAVARSLNLPPTANVRPAPGPMIRTQAPGSASNGFARPVVGSPGRMKSGNPPARSAEGSPPFRPGSVAVPGVASPGAGAAVNPLRQPGQPPQMPPVDARRPDPNIVRPGGIAPTLPPGPVIHSNSRPLPQVIAPSHAEPQHPVPPPVPMPHLAAPVQIPHAEPQHFAPSSAPVPQAVAPTPIPHPEPQHFVQPQAPIPQVVAPAPIPHPEPQHFAPPPAPVPHYAPPAQIPRVEPQHFTPPPAPRPEPPRQAAPPPSAREKRPGER